MSVEQFGYKQELKRALTFWDLVIYGMIFMVPIAPFGVYGYVWDSSKGMVALAYIIHGHCCNQVRKHLDRYWTHLSFQSHIAMRKYFS